ncbi:MAG TPA: hypothetical protein VNO32_38290, partial [Candidatus Acidoferrum sp.]|nr:hypothetical protein [Candidatus Acidoferrum sp.]
ERKIVVPSKPIDLVAACDRLWCSPLCAEGAPLRIEEKGRNEFENQGLVAYGRLCPTALGSVPPSASTQQQSDTQPRPAPHP